MFRSGLWSCHKWIPHLLINSLAPRRCDCNLKLVTLKLLSKIREISVKLTPGECHKTSLMVSQHCFSGESYLYLLVAACWCRYLLTHWGRDKMAAVSQTMFSNIFSWMKMYEFRLKFHWSLFLRFQLTIFKHWFRYWLGAVQATSHYLNQWWLVYWRIYASLGLNELMHCGLVTPHDDFDLGQHWPR